MLNDRSYGEDDLGVLLRFDAGGETRLDQAEINRLHTLYKTGPTRHVRHQSQEALIRGTFWVVRKTAYAYQKRGVPLPDLIQEGVVTLLDYVLPEYEPERNVKFITFAKKSLRRAMLRVIENGTSLKPWRVPVHRHKQAARIVQETDSFRMAYGRNPTTAELLERFGIAEDKLANRMTESHIRAFHGEDVTPIIRLDESDLYAEGEETRHDRIGHQDVQPELAAELRLAFRRTGHRRAQILEVIDRLPERRADIVRAFLPEGERDPIPPKEVARRYGVSRQAIEQQYGKAIQEVTARLPKEDQDVRKIFSEYAALLEAVSCV